MKKDRPDVKLEWQANFDAHSEKLLAAGYTRKDETISVLLANILVFVTALPVALLLFYIWWLCCRHNLPEFDLLAVYIWLLVDIFLTIPIHEALHGLGWHFFAENGWKDIRFGVMWKQLTPYCHCRTPLRVKPYLFGGLLPFLVLGVLFCLIAIPTRSLTLILCGAVNILAAGGDTTIACMMLRYLHKKDAVMLDHPTKVGFVSFTR